MSKRTFLLMLPLLLAVLGSLALIVDSAVSAGGSPAAAWKSAANIAALFALLAMVTGTIPMARHEADSESGFAAALVSTAALVPITVAEVGTVVAYASQAATPTWVQEYAVAIGTIPALTAWVILSALLEHTICAEKQDVEAYLQLRQRLTTVKQRLRMYCAAEEDGSVQAADASEAPALVRESGQVAGQTGPRDETGRVERRRLACAEAEAHMKETEEALTSRGLRWTLATGYIAVWQRLHRAEEALLLLEPPEVVAAEAEYDMSRLQGSNIQRANDLVTQLRGCLLVLNGGETGHQRTGWQQRLRRLMPIGAPPGTVAPGQGAEGVVPSIAVPTSATFTVVQAQAYVRGVRYTINEFRDSAWAALVRQRNHVTEAAILARLYAYILLTLVIIFGVQAKDVFGAGIFYVIGALVGYMSQLRPGDAGVTVEDYGLAHTQLIHTAVFSGLAAVGGVLVTTLVTATTTGSHITGSHTLTGDLIKAFDIQATPVNLLIAATFGLAPSVLFNQLQAVASRYKSNITSSESGTSSL